MNSNVVMLLFVACIAFPTFAATRWRLGYVEAVLPPYLASLCFVLTLPDRRAVAILAIAVVLSGVAAMLIYRRMWDRKPFRLLKADGRARRHWS